jgi:hypothetical protein
MHCRFLEKFSAGFLDFGNAPGEKEATDSRDDVPVSGAD